MYPLASSSSPLDVGREILVVVVETRVDDGDDDVGAARRDVPGRLGPDVDARPAGYLARVAEGPLLAEARVVRQRRLPPSVVRLDVFHFRVGTIGLDGRTQGLSG